MPPRKRAREAPASSATEAKLRKVTVELVFGPPHATTSGRSSALRHMFQMGELCDGSVQLGSRTWKVSRITLAAASSFFRAAFTGGMREGTQGTVSLDPSLDPMRTRAAEAARCRAGGDGAAAHD